MDSFQSPLPIQGLNCMVPKEMKMEVLESDPTLEVVPQLKHREDCKIFVFDSAFWR